MIRNLLVPGLLMVSSIALAQVAMVVDAFPAGASTATGGSFQLAGTVGQPTAAFMNTGSQDVIGGFISWDPFPPIAQCKPAKVQLVKGAATISVSEVDNGSWDNRAIESMQLDRTTFDETDIGDVTVTLTVRDHAGHSATCSTIVSVEAETSSVSEWMALDD